MQERFQSLPEAIRRSPVLSLVLKEAEATLKKSFGLPQINLGQFGKVNFVSERTIAEQYIKNLCENDIVIRGFKEREIPLDNVVESSGIMTTLRTPSHVQYFFSSDKFWQLSVYPIRYQDRETVSGGAYNLFVCLSYLILDEFAKDVPIPKDEFLITHALQQLAKSFQQIASGSTHREAILRLSSQVQKQVADDQNLDIIGKGAQIIFRINGANWYYFFTPYHTAFKDILTDSAASEFIRRMRSRCNWFNLPDKPKRQEHQEKNSQGGFSDIEEELIHAGFASNPQILAQDFLTSRIALEAAKGLLASLTEGETSKEELPAMTPSAQRIASLWLEGDYSERQRTVGRRRRPRGLID